MVDEKDVIILLRSNPYLTISDVASRLNISRNSAAKYLEVLRAKKIVDMRRAGPSKLWFLVEDEKEQAKTQIRGVVEDALRLAREKKLGGPSVDILEKALREMEGSNKEKRRKKPVK